MSSKQSSNRSHSRRSVPPSASSPSPCSRSPPRRESCLKRSHSYFVMMPVVSVLLSLLLLVSPVSLSPSSSSSNHDPHAEAVSDQDVLQHEQPATNIPRILSKGETQTYTLGSTAEMDCNIHDLGPFVVMWLKEKDGKQTVLAAGTTKVLFDERFTMWPDPPKIQIKDLNANDAATYVCSVSTPQAPLEIRYEVRVIPRPATTTTTTSHSMSTHAAGHSHTLLPCSWSCMTGVILLTLSAMYTLCSSFTRA